MENLIMQGQNDGAAADSRKLPIMKTLARLHECDAETLYSRVDASELDVHDILSEMLSKKEVAASSGGGRDDEKFALTLKGWGEYMSVLGSLYELPE